MSLLRLGDGRLAAELGPGSASEIVKKLSYASRLKMGVLHVANFVSLANIIQRISVRLSFDNLPWLIVNANAETGSKLWVLNINPRGGRNAGAK